MTPLAKPAQGAAKKGASKKQRRLTDKPCSLRPTFLSPGDDVQIRWKDGKWHAARVDSVAGDGSASVTYATGQSEAGVSPEWMRRARIEPDTTSARGRNKEAATSKTNKSKKKTTKAKKSETAASQEDVHLAMAISASLVQ